MISNLKVAAVAISLGVALLPACSQRDDAGLRGDACQTNPNANTPMSDSMITTRVKAALLADSTVKGSSISVNTNNGVVALSGKVSSQDERTKAIQLAKAVDGVRDVTDQLGMN